MSNELFLSFLTALRGVMVKQTRFFAAFKGTTFYQSATPV